MVKIYIVGYKDRRKLSQIGVAILEEMMKEGLFEKLTLEEKAE